MKGGIWLLIRLPYNDHVVDDIAGFYIVIDILLTMGVEWFLDNAYKHMSSASSTDLPHSLWARVWGTCTRV